ncbi:MAG: protein-glutamate O-methyltransferase CheR [Bacteriovoracaceae bacterium]|nr:protein-glutamate O-methyltransferase CheR [Bacteriovoracaceae bacterium]
MKRLLESVNLEYGYDFRNYAWPSLSRMLIHAMNKMDCLTLLDLQKKILQNSEHFYDFIQLITIPVSHFFRDPSYFLSLREKVIPYLKTFPSLKIWVAGCSTGEEVYSLAILLQEEKLLKRTTMYATDINPRSLEKAQQGIFDLKTIQMAIPQYQKAGGKKAFTDYYTIVLHSAKFHEKLKENVIFTDHSLATDAVFSETHLISCRNVLIYFNSELQERVINLFYDSLCRKGFLGLGHRETIHFSKCAKHFDLVAKESQIFQKK